MARSVLPHEVTHMAQAISRSTLESLSLVPVIKPVRWGEVFAQLQDVAQNKGAPRIPAFGVIDESLFRRLARRSHVEAGHRSLGVPVDETSLLPYRWVQLKDVDDKLSRLGSQGQRPLFNTPSTYAEASLSSLGQL